MKIAWIGVVGEKLYCVYEDGRTFRLDRFEDETEDGEGRTVREWVEVAQLPP